MEKELSQLHAQVSELRNKNEDMSSIVERFEGLDATK